MVLKTRFIEVIKRSATFRTYWGDDCSNCNGNGTKGYHNAHLPLAKTDDLTDRSIGGNIEDYSIDRWPTHCDNCDAVALELPYNEQLHRQIFRKDIYNTDSGVPEPGDLFYKTNLRGDEGWCYIHDNCDGKHLHVITPNGIEWNIDSRASNCTKPNDKIHRCWVREGTVPNITVGKGGDTCAAGAGSIITGDYHGFLREGKFT